MGSFQTTNDYQPNQSKDNHKKIRVKSVLSYALLPQVLPRIRGLGMHFGHFAYLMALVFASARLLPKNHPALNTANIGHYGVKQVIAMAANNITWSRDHIDQIGIFCAIIIGIILVFLQAILIGFAAIFGFDNPANAQSFFASPNPSNDPIMIMFANIFGELGGFWGDGVAANSPNSTNIIHEAVRAMLALYSLATMAVALIIVVYYIMTVIGEAAKTGTPFGQRFNSLWAPIRLVVALGLLVPLGSGLNSAQYITLWLAKMGSGLGTSVWNEALDVMNADESTRFILDDFSSSWVSQLTFHVFLMEVCSRAQNDYNTLTDPDDYDYVKRRGEGNTSTPESGTPDSRRYKQAVYSYEEKWQNDRWFAATGGVYCGNVSIKMSEEDVQSSITTGANAVPTEDIFNATIATIERITDSGSSNSAGDIGALAQQYVDSVISIEDGTSAIAEGEMEQIFEDLKTQAETIEEELKTSFDGVSPTDMATKMQDFIDTRGDSWAYAGTYYMEISRIIQASHDARLNAIPNTAVVTADTEVDGWTVSGQSKRGADGVLFRIRGADREVSRAVQNILNYYDDNPDEYQPAVDAEGNEKPEACEDVNTESNVLESTTCFIFSLMVPDQLTLLAQDSTRSIDPLAALVTAGYSIVDRSWKFLLAGLVASGGPIFAVFGPMGAIFGGLIQSMAPIFILLGTFGLTAGIVLYFMLPVFPFMYFFFAIVSWVMEIFEAIIAMPLWALAHLRIDGDGMPGGAAINGYYLLLAIFLRPALIVLGLIAGIIIFSGVTYLLQNLWDDVLFVKGAGNMVGLEVLIYTLIFAFFCYSAATTCFKLVDTIPNQILRWIGSSAGTFSDNKEDPGSGATGILTGGAAFLTGSGLNQLQNNIGNAAGTGAKGLKNAGFGIKSQDEKDADKLAGDQQTFYGAQAEKLKGGKDGGSDA